MIVIMMTTFITRRRANVALGFDRLLTLSGRGAGRRVKSDGGRLKFTTLLICRLRQTKPRDFS